MDRKPSPARKAITTTRRRVRLNYAVINAHLIANPLNWIFSRAYSGYQCRI